MAAFFQGPVSSSGASWHELPQLTVMETAFSDNHLWDPDVKHCTAWRASFPRGSISSGSRSSRGRSLWSLRQVSAMCRALGSSLDHQGNLLDNTASLVLTIGSLQTVKKMAVQCG